MVEILNPDQIESILLCHCSSGMRVSYVSTNLCEVRDYQLKSHGCDILFIFLSAAQPVVILRDGKDLGSCPP